MSDEATRNKITAEIIDEVDPYRETKTLVPTHLAARAYRNVREHNPFIAKFVRHVIHARANQGDPGSIALLDMLSDEPFWRGEEDPDDFDWQRAWDALDLPSDPDEA